MKPISPNTDQIPEQVLNVLSSLKRAGFEAFLVGGCVRDLILKRTPKDWDITTNAIPEEIIPLFDRTFYENNFGTVGVVIPALDGSQMNERGEEATSIVEVTPYRLESDYSDSRHPDKVRFSKNILDDLKRRDFTINAIAFDSDKGQFIDPYKGQEDISRGVVRTVGEADERFGEDGLRILRAIRLATELGFMINQETETSIVKNKEILSKISRERIRDEFVKILMAKQPMLGIAMAQRLGILKYIIPELEHGLHMKQTQAHAYDVFEHLLRSMQCAADKNWPLDMRVAALLHDIGKPKTNRPSTKKDEATFYGHEVVGARMTEKILTNLKFPRKTIEKVTKLVRWHMFFSDTEQITISAVRRMIVNVGSDLIWELMDLRVCDRVGTGRPKENPYRLRKYKALIEQAMRDPISVGMLKIDGKGIMETLHMQPGPRIGHILHALFEEVIEDPELNKKEKLEDKVLELNKLNDKDLEKKALAGRKALKNAEDDSVSSILDKYNVK